MDHWDHRLAGEPERYRFSPCSCSDESLATVNSTFGGRSLTIQQPDGAVIAIKFLQRTEGHHDFVYKGTSLERVGGCVALCRKEIGRPTGERPSFLDSSFGRGAHPLAW